MPDDVFQRMSKDKTRWIANARGAQALERFRVVERDVPYLFSKLDKKSRHITRNSGYSCSYLGICGMKFSLFR